MIVAVVVSASYLDQYFGGYRMRSLFPPAFSICVMLGVVATFATYLGTRSTTTRITVVSALLAVVAAAGLLDYEVEVRDLHSLVPIRACTASSPTLFRCRTQPRPADDVISLEAHQRSIPPETVRHSFQAREQLLDRWARVVPETETRDGRQANPSWSS